MMNNDNFLITSFKTNRSQTIYSCKRKATLILNELKKFDKIPNFLTTNLTEVLTSDIYSIFSPYLLRTHWIGVFGMYRQQKNLSWENPISRALLLDILAYSDGYPSWENMQHHLSTTTNHIKTFRLMHNNKLQGELMGGNEVTIFWDDKNHEDNGICLFNPSEEYQMLPIGYSWGYCGSSVHEFARAILYSINPTLTGYSSILTEGFLSYFNQDKPEMLLTELEIKQFIDHYNKNKNIPLKPDRNPKKLNLKDFYSNTEHFESIV